MDAFERPPANHRLLVYVSVVVLVVGLLSAGGLWLVMRPDPAAVPAAGSGEATGPGTLLVALTGDAGLVAAVVVGTGGAAPSGVLVPASLLVDDGGRSVPLGGTVSGGVAAMGQALARTLDVRVDAAWLLTGPALSGLVDAGGGVVVDVDQEIRSGTVLVAAGQGQRLTGPQALAFVTVPREGEGPTAGEDRFATVLGQVLAGLPAGPSAVSAELSRLGQGSHSTLSVARLAAVLGLIGRAVGDAGRLTVTALPVSAAGPGHDPADLVADRASAGELVRQKLGAGHAAAASGASPAG